MIISLQHRFDILMNKQWHSQYKNLNFDDDYPIQQTYPVIIVPAPSSDIIS